VDGNARGLFKNKLSRKDSIIPLFTSLRISITHIKIRIRANRLEAKSLPFRLTCLVSILCVRRARPVRYLRERTGGAGFRRTKWVKAVDESSQIVSKCLRVCLLLSFVCRRAILFSVIVSVTSCKNVLRDSFTLYKVQRMQREHSAPNRSELLMLQ
jgi:hypothetical protein